MAVVLGILLIALLGALVDNRRGLVAVLMVVMFILSFLAAYA